MQGERIDVHSMSAQQRTDFAYGKVRSLYEIKVREAEKLRTETVDFRLNILLNKFASVRTQQNLEQGLTKRENLGADVNQATQTVDLGMAGLFRIGQVHENSMVTRDKQNRSEHIKKAYGWYDRHEAPISIRRTTDSVNISIHGDPIHWGGERTQDLLRTSGHEDREDSRVKTVERQLNSTFTVLKRDDDWDLDPNKRNKVAGTLSALGMIKIQRARFTQDLNLFREGFNQVQEAHGISSNSHRMATASMWLAAYSLHPKFNTESKSLRLKLALKGISQFSQILRSPDYKQAISAVRQASPIQNIIKQFLAPFKSGS